MMVELTVGFMSRGYLAPGTKISIPVEHIIAFCPNRKEGKDYTKVFIKNCGETLYDGRLNVEESYEKVQSLVMNSRIHRS